MSFIKKNKKIVILLPKFVFSGAGNSVFKLTNYLIKNKQDVSIICLGQCDYKKKILKKIKIYELNKNRILYSLPHIWFILKKYSESYNHVLLYSGHHYANIVSILIKIFIKKLIVICVERTALFELKIFLSKKEIIKKKIIYFLVKHLYKFADHIISNTKFTKKELFKHTNSYVHQIYPPTLLRIKKFSYKKINKKFKICWVGRLDFEKGLEDLILASKKLNIRCVIYILGKGNSEQYYKELAKQNKSRLVEIIFINFTHDVNKYYKNCHLLINTSRFEGCNNSIIEAINNNLFVIASNSPGGNREILFNSKLGMLYKNADYINLSKKISLFTKRTKYYQNKIKKNKKKLGQFLFKPNIRKTYDLLVHKI